MGKMSNVVSSITGFITNASTKGKILLALIFLVFLAFAGLLGFQMFDYTQSNPNFCVSCHLMQESFDAWAGSVHTDINCHECHHLSVKELNGLMVSFIFHRPTEVPERHGKVIVPWKYCIKCHWEEDEKYPEAPKINESKLHAKHYFTEQIECSKCHGYIVHQFKPEERFCEKCHTGIEVHGTGMVELACLNCHTDRTADLRPDRDKCLYCHGSESDREKLVAEGRVDLRAYEPPKEAVEQATKIAVPKDAPMQFFCYECHKPHEKVRPTWGDCLECHRNIQSAGAHKLHINQMGMTCGQCHKPHQWVVTEAQAKKDCTTCHSYRNPMNFIK